MNGVLSLSLCSCQGRCPVDGQTQGRKDNPVGSWILDGNTVAPHSDSRTLKDRNKQMITVWDFIVGESCLRGLLSEKEDPSE